MDVLEVLNAFNEIDLFIEWFIVGCCKSTEDTPNVFDKMSDMHV